MKCELHDIHDVYWVFDGPTQRKLGVRRTRMVVVGINKKTMRWA